MVQNFRDSKLPLNLMCFPLVYADYLPACSHFWFATVQEVLHADWQEAWHSPQPPLAAVSFKLA